VEPACVDERVGLALLHQHGHPAWQVAHDVRPPDSGQARYASLGSDDIDRQEVRPWLDGRRSAY
jgi:hypothetical protein